MDEYSLKAAGYTFSIIIGTLSSLFFLKDIVDGLISGNYIHHSAKFGVTLHWDAALSFMIGFLILGVFLVIFGLLGLKNLYGA